MNGSKLLLVLLSVATPLPAAADCMLMGLAPKLATKPDAVVPPDGGIVVAAGVIERGSLDPGDVTVQKGWTMLVPVGKTSAMVEPTITQLAPGLAVYTAPGPTLSLYDAIGTRLTTATRGAEVPRLPAPVIASLRYEAPISRRSVKRVEVKLRGAPPPRVLALVLADAQGTARSWGPVDGSVFYPYLERDCYVLPNGTVPSKKGDRVTLYWVDEHGRKSASTKPLTIN